VKGLQRAITVQLLIHNWIRPDWGWTKEPPQQWQWALSTSSDDAGILDYTRVFGYHKLETSANLCNAIFPSTPERSVHSPNQKLLLDMYLVTGFVK
jgi:hypothetical protein